MLGLLLLLQPWACSLLVDPEVGSSLGPADAQTPDLPVDMGTLDVGTPDDGVPPDMGGGCTIDSDCITSLGPRFRCARSQCFNLDAPCARTERVSGGISSNTTWFADTCYQLADPVFVRAGAMLTIHPGTTIQGLAPRSALIVTRDARIMAVGTERDPIVFTSNQAVGSRRPGDWGGVALLGRAPINVGEDFLEGLPETADTAYGGTDPETNCGTLRYVRIEFAGFDFANNNELNGLTLAGCGFDTKVEFVQVHYGSDDGVEIFGGEVGLKWVVISRAQDDSLDWDQGWTGFAQFVAILQDAPQPSIDPSIYTGGDRGIEADSRSPTDPGMPRSRPRLYNFTMVGSQQSGSRTLGMMLRDSTSADIRNFLMLNYALGMWDVQDLVADCLRVPLGTTCTPPDAFELDGLLLYNMGRDGNTYVVPETEDDDGGFNEAAYITTSTSPRIILLDRITEDPSLFQPFIDQGPVDLRPIGTSPANISNLNPPAFENPPEQVQPSGRDYLGAFEPGTTTNWMSNWTSFPVN